VTATILSGAVIVVNIITDIDEPAWLTGVALSCLALAVVFAVPPFFYLGKYGMSRNGDPYYSTTRVVEHGVYSLVRHPQYLGYTLLVLGFACLDPNWIAIVLAIGASAMFYAQAISEENFCSEKLGVDYDDYVTRVPRFNFVKGLFRVLRKRIDEQ
jgi:protein-S-isoprenylcysteine O-methyltransferase Ste14